MGAESAAKSGDVQIIAPWNWKWTPHNTLRANSTNELSLPKGRYVRHKGESRTGGGGPLNFPFKTVRENRFAATVCLPLFVFFHHAQCPETQELRPAVGLNPKVVVQTKRHCFGSKKAASAERLGLGFKLSHLAVVAGTPSLGSRGDFQ